MLKGLSRPKKGVKGPKRIQEVNRGNKETPLRLDGRLLNDKEAAKYLGLAPKWGYQQVQKWVREGKLRGGRVGDMHRFKTQDLDDFVFSRK